MYEINLIKARTVTRHRRRLRRVVLLGYFAVVYVVTLMIVQAGGSLNAQIEDSVVQLDQARDRSAELAPQIEAMDARESALDAAWERVRLKQRDLDNAPRLAPITEFLGRWFDRVPWRESASIESIVVSAPAIDRGVVIAHGWLRTPDVDTRADAMLAELTSAYMGQRNSDDGGASGSALTDDERATFASLRTMSRLPLLTANVLSETDERTVRFQLVFAHDAAAALRAASRERGS